MRLCTQGLTRCSDSSSDSDFFIQNILSTANVAGQCTHMLRFDGVTQYIRCDIKHISGVIPPVQVPVRGVDKALIGI